MVYQKKMPNLWRRYKLQNKTRSKLVNEEKWERNFHISHERKNEYYLFLIMSDTERTEINKVLNVVRKLGRRTEKNKREKQINSGLLSSNIR